MRVANVDGRAVLVLSSGRALDLATASRGRFDPDPQGVYDNWDDVQSWWGAQHEPAALPGSFVYDATRAGIPVPRPRQIFCLGANYGKHAAEAGVEPPESPVIFTKFPSCLTGPSAPVPLPSRYVDWEVELVVVIGRTSRNVAVDEGWQHVAGVTVGQDLSERVLQRQGPLPQLSMAKSLPGFGPIGPEVVSVSELADPDDLSLGCAVNGEQMQASRTSDLLFDVPTLVAYISSLCTMFPGDLIFTGTPEGVGATRTPPQFLRPGDVLETWVDGVGRLRNVMVETTDRVPRPSGRSGNTAVEVSK